LTKFEELKSRNVDLSYLIDNASKIGNHDEAIKLKKELYQNKLTMLNMLQTEDRRAGITARQLKSKVDAMPNVPKYATGTPLDGPDALDGGVEVGSLVIFGGASGTGKSTLTLEVVCNVAKYAPAVFFNLEMGERRIRTRLGKVLETDEQWDNLIVDSYSRTLDDILMEVEIHAADGIKFFVIDSRMKIEVTSDGQEYQKISAITKALSSIAQRLDVIIFLINQISEDDLKTGRLAFKGSGDQKYDSDISLFYVNDEENENARKLICTKNRTGNEKLFQLDLTINEKGKTVCIGGYVPVKTIEYNHSDMAVI
jgi:predicted ATP-dependent serine protease